MTRFDIRFSSDGRIATQNKKVIGKYYFPVIASQHPHENANPAHFGAAKKMALCKVYF